MDIFDKIDKSMGHLGQYADQAHGYFTFPKLEGEIGTRMKFNGKERLVWSLNDYLGLANHPEVRKADAEAAAKYGFGHPMGSRMLTGNSDYHEQLEKTYAEYAQKEDAILVNFGYQGNISLIQALLDRRDVVIYDSLSHACIIDGVVGTLAKRFIYEHNNMEQLEKRLQNAVKIVEKTGGGILVITEGVFGMKGDLGYLPGIVELKKKYPFRILIDDAHGFGVMGKTGMGTAEHYGVQQEIDIIFNTFAKSMAMIGGFIAGDKKIMRYLRYNMRSQIYAKTMPTALVLGAIKRLEILRNDHARREHLWTVVNALQEGFKARGFDIGPTQSPVTPVYMKGSIWECRNLSLDLRENYNIFMSVVTYPVIEKGAIILRVIPTANHTLEDVNYTLNAFAEIRAKLDAGAYNDDNLVSGFIPKVVF